MAILEPLLLGSVATVVSRRNLGLGGTVVLCVSDLRRGRGSWGEEVDGVCIRGWCCIRDFFRRVVLILRGASMSSKQKFVSPVAFFHFSSKQGKSLFRFLKKQTDLDKCCCATKGH